MRAASGALPRLHLYLIYFFYRILNGALMHLLPHRLLPQFAVLTLLFFSVPIEPGSGLPSSAVEMCPAHSSQITVMTVPSAVYKHSIRVSVYLPLCDESSTKPLPVIYLLHGGGADETQWPDLRVQTESDALIASGVQPFVVIMPGGDYGAAVDYAIFVFDELIPAMRNQLPIRTDPAGQAIGGLSLGGYWALNIAFHHPDQFAAVGGYSPVVASASNDLVSLARTATGLDQLRFALDVGDADPLAAGARQLSEALHARGLSVSFTINSGGHNRPYWRSHTHDYLSFMTASFTSPVHWPRCRAIVN
jgi:enterochelin esterase-like enzyme